MPDAEPPEVSPAWRWPAEWAIERAFWREVAARTLAGVLTLVVIGVPALLYAGASGVLTFDRVAPILIGVGLALLIAVGYVAALAFIGRLERRRIARVISASESSVRVTIRTEDLHRYSMAQRAAIESARRSSRRSTIGTTFVGMVTAGAMLAGPGADVIDALVRWLR